MTVVDICILISAYGIVTTVLMGDLIIQHFTKRPS